MSAAKTTVIKHVTVYSVYLLLAWGFYRLLFKLPETVEEVFIKPILWLVPIFWLNAKEKFSISSLGITFKKLFPSIYLSLGLGAIFVIEAVLTNFYKYGHINFAANIGEMPILPSLGVSFATAFSEEIAFRGYVFGRLWHVLEDEWAANLASSVIWTLVHIPITFFVLKLGPADGIVYLLITMVFGVGSAFVFGKTKNVFGSILLHVLWEWPIILFR